MSKVFVVVFTIFGTVVGSGFSSGKEIMVFFSRFGVLSYLYILIACLLFFLLFFFFLTHAKSINKLFEKSKWLNVVVIFLAVVFCASMFAGLKSLFFYFPAWIYSILTGVLIVGCIVVTLKGIKGLQRLNLILMPACFLIFLVVLFYSLSVSSDFSFSANSWAGVLYGPLYVALNTSMNGFIFAKVGVDLSKKQAFFASLFSCLLLMIFLLLGNFVLQQNTESFASEMPFLYLVSKNGGMFVLAYSVILIGCFTTLISLCVTLKSAFEKVIKNELFATFVSVFLPFFVSALGFSSIISFLYPICSVFGIFVLLYLIWHEFWGGNAVEFSPDKNK